MLAGNELSLKYFFQSPQNFNFYADMFTLCRTAKILSEDYQEFHPQLVVSLCKQNKNFTIFSDERNPCVQAGILR